MMRSLTSDKPLFDLISALLISVSLLLCQNLDMKWSNSLPLIQFVLKSDLSYFQERPSGVDRKDSFKDELQERIEVE